MGRIYCEVCGANWRSSGDGPEAQEHHVDVPCVGESTEFKQRAQIAALTERLRIVEAEREEARERLAYEQEITEALRDPLSTRIARRGCDDEHHMEHHAREDALRAELERKDAALKVIAESDEWSGGLSNTSHQERARAALQPKEPPCQKA